MSDDSQNWYVSFFFENKVMIIVHILITLLLLPLEIFVYAYFSRQIFKSIQEKNYPALAKSLVIFILFLIALQVVLSIRYFIDGKLRAVSQLYIRQNYMDTFLEKNDEDYTNSTCIHQMDVIPDAFFQYYNSILLFWTPIFGLCFFFVVFCFWIDKRVGIMTLLFFAAFSTVLIVCLKEITTFAREIFYQNENILEQYENMFMNNETIRSTDNKKNVMKQMQTEEQNVKSNNAQLNIYINSLQFSLLFVTCIYFIGTFFYIYRKCRKKTIPFSKFIMFSSVGIFCLNQLFSKLSMIYGIIIDKGSLEVLENVEKFVEPAKEFSELEGYQITLKDVSYSVDKQNILTKMNFTFPEKSTILIKGSIGSGKSTFIKLLLGWYQPTKGVITIGSVPIERIPLKILRKRIYMMSQKTTLFSDMTILENIFYPNAVDEHSLRSLSLPSSFVNIFHRKVQKHGTNISGGQKRLVHVLRAWLNPAPIIILDEPIDNIDQKTIEVITRIISDISIKKTLICISHIPLSIKPSQIIDFDKNYHE